MKLKKFIIIPCILLMGFTIIKIYSNLREKHYWRIPGHENKFRKYFNQQEIKDFIEKEYMESSVFKGESYDKLNDQEKAELKRTYEKVSIGLRGAKLKKISLDHGKDKIPYTSSGIYLVQKKIK